MTQIHRPVGRGDRVFLVDGSSFVFRAYFQSIRQDQKYNYRADRLPVGAVRLFATKLLQFIRDGAAGIKPTHLAIIFDKSEDSFRREIYPAYKAHRPDPPEDLIPQFPLMRAVVRAFGLRPVEQDRYEADDLIATYARHAKERGAETLIISADKDLMQLIRPGVSMYDPASGEAGAKGSREERKIGEAEVLEYFGAGPDKVIDIQALAGDSTDNIPGAPGIGVKTAAQLIAEYGDLETLLQRAGEIKQPKRRDTLTNPETVKLIRISKQLVSLVDNVEVEDRLDDLALTPPDAKTLIAFFKAMEFTTLTRRAAEIYGVEAGAIEPDPAFVGPAGWRNRNGEAKERSVDWPSPAPIAAEIPAPTHQAPPQAAELAQAQSLTPAAFAAQRLAEAREAKIDRSGYATVRTLDALRGWVAEAFEAGFVALDVETDSLDPMQADLVGFSLCVAPGKACYVPLGHRTGTAGDLFGGGELLPDQIKESEALALLKPLLEARDVLKIGHNVKFHWVIFAQRGIEMKSTDDTMLISYALDAAATTDGHGMDWLSQRFLGHETIKFSDVAGVGRTFVGFARVPIDKAAEYAAEDVDVTLRLWRALKARLPAEHVNKVYETLERPLIAPLARMER